MSSEKALARSISFRPGWLYAEAQRYGAQLDKPENVSEVVCGFVRQGLTAAGWELPADGKRPRRVILNPEMASAIKEALTLNIDPVAAIRARIAEATGGKPV
jgi:hypothetical protein